MSREEAAERLEIARLLRRRDSLRRTREQVAVARQRWLHENQALELQQAARVELLMSYAATSSYIGDRLDYIGQLHVLNDAFFIWFDGRFATINGFRLGRSASEAVQWHEVNAALGQIALLLDCVGFTSATYYLQPHGSASRIGKASDAQRESTYPLYTDDSFSLLPKRNFNLALVYMLRFIEELSEHVNLLDRALSLPYKVKNDRINNSVVSYASKEEDWTLAMKYVLTDLKWVVAWLAKHKRTFKGESQSAARGPSARR